MNNFTINSSQLYNFNKPWISSEKNEETENLSKQVELLESRVGTLSNNTARMGTNLALKMRNIEMSNNTSSPKPFAEAFGKINGLKSISPTISKKATQQQTNIATRIAKIVIKRKKEVTDKSLVGASQRLVNRITQAPYQKSQMGSDVTSLITFAKNQIS